MEEEALAVASAAPALPGEDAGVRVVARICPAPPTAAAGTTTTAAPAPAAGTSSFQVAASRGRRPRASGPGAGAVLSFTPVAAAPTPSSSSQGRAAGGQRKEEHRLDWCYLQDETNHQVFLHELHPILHHHMHLHNQATAGSSSSSNACVVACGAAAAKDHLFKGSQEQPGLVTMAMEEILGFAASIGGAVRVSSYQVVQDTHVFDLLEPKEQEVLVLEDAQGKTHLKGLSKVHVKSIEDFSRLGCFDENQDKQQQPTKASSTQQQPTKPFSTQQQPTKASSTQLLTRGHQGLIVHVSSSDQDGKERAVAKINFLSLTDYVDPKQKTGGGAAALSSGNKSLYTLMNVVQALNSNQSFVPYRQSKVTRILQDSLCKTSGAVVIACLEEVSCQDAVSTLSLAARLSQAATQVANEQCRRSASVTSFKRADVNLSAVAKSSSRPILSSTNLPNPVVEKQDRPQWNMSAVKASRTPVPNKRSQPIIHSAKKSENLLATPIKITQKDATPTMSGRSQPITHSAKKPESTVSPPTKMKQKDAKPAMSGRSQVIMRSAKKTESSLSASTKLKQKDAKPTTSESALLCPSTNSAKEDEVAVAPATVTKAEEVVSSQGVEIDAPSTEEGFDKTFLIKHQGLDTVPSEVQKVVSSGMSIDAPSADEGFHKTSDALDTASSDIQKVVSSGMEEENHSTSSLDAASSCTIDSGETCSPNIPDAFVEKTPVQGTPKISDKLREISNSLKLLNARPLSVMPQKIAKEKTQEEGIEKTQKVAMEKTLEVAMETTQEEGMETTQEVGMETTQEVGKERTQEEGMEVTQEVAIETTQEVAVEMTQEAGMGTTQEVAIETKQEVAIETTQEVAVETAQEVAVETKQEAGMETTEEVAIETTQEVAVEAKQNVSIETTQEVAVETKQEMAIETTQEVAIETSQEVGMEYVQGGTNIGAAPEPKTPAMHLKVEQAADPKTPAIHLKFEHAADHPASSFKDRSTGIKRCMVQECMTFLNSANKEQLKSLKGIGEKRANYIIELREQSPELFKGIDDLRNVIGMNKTEIKRMMSGIISSP